MTAETDKPKIFDDERQIAALDAAVANGWRITKVETMISNPLYAVGSYATVHLSKEIATPYPPEPIRYDGFETCTQEWGCGLAAGQHARDLMGGAP